MNNILVLDKYSPSNDFWDNLKKRKNFLNMSLHEVIQKFNGFEGNLLSIFPIWSQIDFDETLISVNNNVNCYKLVLYVTGSEDAKINHKKLSFIGYDFGICEVDATNYSSIFNEVLFGKICELVSYKDLLNNNLLFNDRAVATDYAIQHHKLLLEGKDVEYEEYMKIYRVYKYDFDKA